MEYAQAATYLIAIALLRLRCLGLDTPARLPDGLPLHTLSAARPWLDTLERTSCRSWGQLRALPRGGVARRLRAPAGRAGHGLGPAPELCDWLTLPEVFDVGTELPALATTAPELLWTAQRLLTQLQAWLRARERGALALELQWALDLKRLDGVALPSHQQLLVRTARPAQDMAHLRRLVAEQLARVSLAAPANHLRLRLIDSAPWRGSSQSFLPEDNRPGERLHELVERLSARLGPHSVRVPLALTDRPARRQQLWVAARDAAAPPAPAGASAADALYPTWLLPEPLALTVRQHVPRVRRAAAPPGAAVPGGNRLVGKRRSGAARLLHCPQPAGRAGVGVPRAARPGCGPGGGIPLAPAGPVCLSRTSSPCPGWTTASHRRGWARNPTACRATQS